MADDDGPKKEEKAGAPAWMCTFADLMSLLLCFFVLLLSFSVMDNMKYKQVAGSMKDAFGLQQEKVVDQTPQGQQMISQEFQTVPLNVQVVLQETLAEEIAAGIIEAEHGPEGMILRVKDSIAFDSGRAVIKKEFLPLLDKLGLVAAQFDLHFEVAGHTDNVPISEGAFSFSSNYDLSASRAVAIVDYWRSKLSIPPEKLTAMGYADGKPIDDNKTIVGRARNRRVEFRIKPLGSGLAFEGIEEIIQR